MPHVLKVFLKVIQERINQKINKEFGSNQFGSRAGSGKREGLFCFKIIAQKHVEINIDLYYTPVSQTTRKTLTESIMPHLQPLFKENFVKYLEAGMDYYIPDSDWQFKKKTWYRHNTAIFLKFVQIFMCLYTPKSWLVKQYFYFILLGSIYRIFFFEIGFHSFGLSVRIPNKFQLDSIADKIHIIELY